MRWFAFWDGARKPRAIRVLFGLTLPPSEPPFARPPRPTRPRPAPHLRRALHSPFSLPRPPLAPVILPRRSCSPFAPFAPFAAKANSGKTQPHPGKRPRGTLPLPVPSLCFPGCSFASLADFARAFGCWTVLRALCVGFFAFFALNGCLTVLCLRANPGDAPASAPHPRPTRDPPAPPSDEPAPSILQPRQSLSPPATPRFSPSRPRPASCSWAPSAQPSAPAQSKTELLSSFRKTVDTANPPASVSPPAPHFPTIGKPHEPFSNHWKNAKTIAIPRFSDFPNSRGPGKRQPCPRLGGDVSPHTPKGRSQTCTNQRPAARRDATPPRRAGNRMLNVGRKEIEKWPVRGESSRKNGHLMYFPLRGKMPIGVCGFSGRRLRQTGKTEEP